MNIVNILSDIVKRRGDDIADWFAAQYDGRSAPFYSSVDIRHSGYKIAPVDTNLFPAGFNNLTDRAIEKGAEMVRQYMSDNALEVGKVLILPESHTRNQGYIDNLYKLRQILQLAGLEAVIGRMEEGSAAVELVTSDNVVLLSVPIRRDGNVLMTIDGYVPDMILVNNDLTSGAPKILCSLEQAVVPCTGVGWYRRKKSESFSAYNNISSAFAREFGIDKWLISTFVRNCGVINFKERTGLECAAIGVEKLLHKLRDKYRQYGIDSEPYVFIKADSGTYGMGIMTARSGDDIYNMNKKTRNKMNIIKEGVQNSDVVIQEGVITIDRVGDKIAEPVIYLMNGRAIGGAWRINERRDSYVNLNAAGMSFVPMCHYGAAAGGRDSSVGYEGDDFGLSCRLIAELASLAATYEEYSVPHPCLDADFA